MGVAIDTVVVFAAGSGTVPRVAIPSGAVVVAADGGVELALELGVPVDVVVGDLDSIAPDSLETLERAGVRIERHPQEKDATDLALALDAALGLGPRRILLVGAAGGRLDHLLGELLLLGAEDYAAVEIDAYLGAAAVHVVRGERSLVGTPGELVSLHALHGPAVGVVTEGLLYPLRGETLAAGSSRGISNVFAAEEARISLERGVVLALRPGEES
ncbi:MAG: thiamine diphosphokinase [Gaiellaceae bacterium]